MGRTLYLPVAAAVGDDLLTAGASRVGSALSGGLHVREWLCHEFPAPYNPCMSRRGRPRVGVRISFRLPEPALAALTSRARATGVSRSEALRVIVEDALRTTGDGVDRSQIDARLALSPAERVRTMARDAGRLQAIRGRATS